MQTEVFLDTSYAIALAASTDQNHARAIVLANELDRANTRLITTHAVLFEIGNSLARLRYRSAAVTLLTSIENDYRVAVIAIDGSLYAKGRELFEQRLDKEWSLTDCCSFIAMRERNLTEALTADRHFVQAGFDALLLSP